MTKGDGFMVVVCLAGGMVTRLIAKISAELARGLIRVYRCDLI